MDNETIYYCSQKINYSEDITLLTLKPLTSKKIEYISGQYVQVLLPNGKLLPLSIANAPREDGSLDFHLRHYHQKNEAHEGFLSDVEQKKPLMLYGPCGTSTLERIREDNNKIIFLAGGTGFSPIKALLETALTQPQYSSLVLYWGIRRPNDAYDLKLLEQWKKTHSHFHFELVLSDFQSFPLWKGQKGLVHEYCWRDQKEFTNSIVFASGPFDMVHGAYNLFTQHGLLPQSFISDIILN